MSAKRRRKRSRSIGVHISTARKAAGLSQQQVAHALGIPQRTVSYYESEAGDLPSSLLVPLAEILHVEVHELLGIEDTGSRKTRLQKQFEAVRKLPRKEQDFVEKFLDQVLDDNQRKQKKGGKRAQN